ncbi:uncharacterized protein EDB91DRAFT_1230512 [Suillus paluster]|uniref:uncharacterized protein n=1 Tax=Suillus paluster TaxID=48578 RepID=UPI001B885D93|nr:uncharacterized protein EDB91DRAFT_1230512 [Suillus paluster]KAG1722738.1 hypothetical protein EDB91DRAFT_1230512 [Suillus paluster]
MYDSHLADGTWRTTSSKYNKFWRNWHGKAQGPRLSEEEETHRGDRCVHNIIFPFNFAFEFEVLVYLECLSADYCLDVPAPPAPARVTYYLSIFSEAELRKAEKQRKSLNSFLQQTADLPFDTLKAQLLTQISAKLNPSKISHDDYDIDWTVPRIQPSPLALASDSDYNFLLQHATKHKEPQANITIKVRMNKNRRNKDTDTSSGEDDVGSENESDDDRRPKKKTKKTSAKEKAKVLETNLNIKIDTKIQQLRDRWMCSKPGCTSEFCFIHTEHPEHFPLGREHLSVWAAAWNKDEAQANLETPPNHAKFNALPGQKGTASLLQRRLAERTQPANQPHGPVINFNIPPELLAVFRPPAVLNSDIPQPAPAGSRTEGDRSQDSLIPYGVPHGPTFSLNEFCSNYTLSNDIRTKLHQNGYTGTETICYILISELKEMEFKLGEIAAMRAAMKRWCK